MHERCRDQGKYDAAVVVKRAVPRNGAWPTEHEATDFSPLGNTDKPHDCGSEGTAERGRS